MSAVHNQFDLNGQVALVTGGAGLLGREFVRTLAAAGCTVYSIDLNGDALASSRAGYLPELRSRVTPVGLDITRENDVDSAIDHIFSENGRIDILINSAAVDPKFDAQALSEGENPGAFTSYSLENWRRSMDVNLTGTFLVSRSACRHMEPTGRGVIVNISSTYGLVGPDQRIYEKAGDDGSRFFKPLDYSVTKAGMLGFTRALAAYYQNTSIRVNALTPGGTFNDNPDEFVEKYSYRTIAGRMAAPDDYSGAIMFLCSDASRYMTGANLVVDGGWTAL